KPVLAHPRSGERDQREPEEQVQVGPQRRAVHPGYGRQHVVVVVPIGPQVHEAEHVGQEHRQLVSQRMPISTSRDVQLEHHDRDQDGDHAIAKTLDASLGHGWSLDGEKRREGRSDLAPAKSGVTARLTQRMRSRTSILRLETRCAKSSAKLSTRASACCCQRWMLWISAIST